MAATVKTPEKMFAFLTVLAETCNVGKACEAVGLGRATAYKWREDDPEFARAWDKAKAIGADALEDEAVRRAHDGVEEPVFYKGIATGAVRKYSDTLLIFLLKGAKPEKYKDRVASEVSGPGGAPIEIDEVEAAKRIRALLDKAKERHGRGDDLA